MKKSVLFALTLTALTVMLTLGGCGRTNTSGPNNGNVVTIYNSAFSPTPLTVAVGTTVTWKNGDSTAHTATADNSSAFHFDTGGISPGAASAVTFTQAGTFEYFCNLHPAMRGKIVVL